MTTLLQATLALAVVVFAGNIFLMVVWRMRAERTREQKVLLFANQTIVFTDRVLLRPAVLLTTISANLLATRLGVVIYTSPRLIIPMSLSLLSGVVWVIFLVPTQKKQLRLCLDVGSDQALPEQYFQLSKRWRNWALVAAALVATALILVATGIGE